MSRANLFRQNTNKRQEDEDHSGNNSGCPENEWDHSKDIEQTPNINSHYLPRQIKICGYPETTHSNQSSRYVMKPVLPISNCRDAAPKSFKSGASSQSYVQSHPHQPQSSSMTEILMEDKDHTLPKDPKYSSACNITLKFTLALASWLLNGAAFYLYGDRILSYIDHAKECCGLSNNIL